MIFSSSAHTKQSICSTLKQYCRCSKNKTWTEACENSFRELKVDLTPAPVLIAPDPSRPYELIVDACGEGVGAVLLQNGQPIAYESKKFIPAATLYTVT